MWMIGENTQIKADLTPLEKIGAPLSFGWEAGYRPQVDVYDEFRDCGRRENGRSGGHRLGKRGQ